MGIVLEILILGKMEKSSLPVIVRYIMPVSQLPHDKFTRPCAMCARRNVRDVNDETGKDMHDVIRIF